MATKYAVLKREYSEHRLNYGDIIDDLFQNTLSYLSVIIMSTLFVQIISNQSLSVAPVAK